MLRFRSGNDSVELHAAFEQLRYDRRVVLPEAVQHREQAHIRHGVARDYDQVGGESEPEEVTIIRKQSYYYVEA